MISISGCPRRRSAFTLIELLVVIAIIAILAAILFPVFAQAREKARQTACLSNSKQMSLALMQYYQDYDEVLPAGGYNTGSWNTLIFPYVKNEGVYLCPSDTKPIKFGGFAISYVANYAVLAPYRFTGKALAQFEAPADTIAVTERNTNQYGMTAYHNNGTPMTLAEVMDPRGIVKQRVAWNRHNQGMNNVFLDGHAKWHRLENTVTPKWLWGPARLTQTRW